MKSDTPSFGVLTNHEFSLFIKPHELLDGNPMP